MSKTKISVESVGMPRKFHQNGRSVTFVPLSIKQRHNRKLLVPPAGQPALTQKSSFDVPMIRAIGRAFYWQRLLDNGEVRTAEEIADRHKLKCAWVWEMLRLTRLAPDILTAMLEGKQPRHLNLQAIRRGIPVDWAEQRRVLGFVPE